LPQCGNFSIANTSTAAVEFDNSDRPLCPLDLQSGEYLGSIFPGGGENFRS
jgi:hypothetical protein